MNLRRSFIALAVVVTGALVAAGCGGDDSSSSGSDDSGAAPKGKIATPAPLEAGGEFVVCTDVPYPPAEFLEGDEFVGYEIDLMNEVAKRIGTKAVYEKTLFDSIIPALQGKKCDAIISSMNVTPEREKQVAFVQYMEIGQSLMVPAGEGKGINGLEDLGGKSVAVQVGTTLKTALDEQSAKLEEDGEDPIDVQTFPDAGAAAAALRGNKVDVFFADSPVIAEYVNGSKKEFEFAGDPISPIAVGIAMRKDDKELQDAVDQAVTSMYDDGTLVDILSQWTVQDFALKGVGDTAE